MGSAIHSRFSMVSHPVSMELIWKRFLGWSQSQQSNRFLWMAFIMMGHCCVITPAVLTMIFISGNHFFYWPIAIVALMACLAVNIAGLPTKTTIPVFVISLIIDVIVIICSVAHGIDLNVI